MLRRHPYWRCHPQGNGKNMSGSRIQKLCFGHTKLRYSLDWKEVLQERLSVAATDAPSSADQPRGPGILSPYFPDIIKNSNDFTGVCLGVKGDLTVVDFLKKKKKENYLFIYLAASALRCGKDLSLQLEALVAACRLSCSMACEILIPKPWIKPRSPTPARQTLNLWTTREVPSWEF